MSDRLPDPYDRFLRHHEEAERRSAEPLDVGEALESGNAAEVLAFLLEVAAKADAAPPSSGPRLRAAHRHAEYRRRRQGRPFAHRDRL